MQARIYKPSKTAMQSGSARTKQWVLEFEAESGKTVDPLMGWIGSSDMKQQLRLEFDNMDDAVAYAKRQGITYTVKANQVKKRRIQAYADNFK